MCWSCLQLSLIADMTRNTRIATNRVITTPLTSLSHLDQMEVSLSSQVHCLHSEMLKLELTANLGVIKQLSTTLLRRIGNREGQFKSISDNTE